MKRHGERCQLLEVVLFFFFIRVFFFFWFTCGIKGKNNNEGISRRPSRSWKGARFWAVI